MPGDPFVVPLWDKASLSVCSLRALMLLVFSFLTWEFTFSRKVCNSSVLLLPVYRSPAFELQLLKSQIASACYNWFWLANIYQVVEECC